MPQGPVPVHRAPVAIADMVQLSRAGGAANARLILHPEQLGGVEVQLRHTADGLEAVVRADHPEALVALERGATELRRALEDRGVTLNSLDFGLTGEQHERRSEQRAASGGPVRLSGGEPEDAIAAETDAPHGTSVRAAGAVLVDVLA